MALLPKKTYSRRNNECSFSVNEKENVDPFDELLSSPLKQNVQFKPLSFWNRKIRNLEAEKKSKNVKCELYETSNSEDNSPNIRKKNPRSKYSKHRAKTLPLKNISQNKNNVFSNVRSSIKKSKSIKPATAVENTTVVSWNEFGKLRSQSSNNALYFSKSTSPIFKSLHENCDGVKYVSAIEEDREENYLVEHNINFNGTTNPPKIQKHNIKNVNSTQTELEKNTIFKVYGDATSEKKNLEALYDKTLIHNESEESENLTLAVNMTTEETLIPHHKSDNNFKYITVKRFFNNFNKNNESFTQDAVGLKLDNESPNYSLSTLKEINGPEDSTFAMSEEFDIPGGNSENINKGVSTDGVMDDSFISVELYNDNNKAESTLSLAAYEGDVETSSVYSDEEDFISTTFSGSEILRKSLTYIIHASANNEETKPLSKLEFETNSSDLNISSHIYSNNNNSEDFIQDLSLEWNENLTGEAESSSTSEENPFYLEEEESVISVNSSPKGNNTLTGDYSVKKESPQCESSSKGLSYLTTGISHLTLSSDSDLDELTPKSKAQESQFQENDRNYKDTKNCSAFIDLRNVTRKRKYRLKNNYEKDVSDADGSLFLVNPLEETEIKNNLEKDWESNETLEHSIMTNEDKISFDWNKTLCFVNPVFESTRVQDVSGDAAKFEKTLNQSQKMGSVSSESQIGLDHSYALKPGKKWLRSVSVLKQIRNGSCLESTRIKGRHFESFVKDMLEMQSGKSGWPTLLADVTNPNEMSAGSGLKKPFPISTCYSDVESENSLKDITFKGSNFSVSRSDGTVLETSLINPTIKVINPEEKSSSFGLDMSDLSLKGESVDSNKSACLSGRDFILLQCGQDDVLPFEEYFNERTLKDCKKIGEGVYGEVFKTSDAVIKIIPIEGSEKVNGEPQKTFEEILSEVVIALKLSNLRNGRKNRTDGFSEVKRCWCVKGKYPKYLLRLWNEYDQSGSGSENDSPVMFKDDQLYIILELANGGKDLESFVFSSASQSLSIFVQTALSLAVAEKALEFEHRDLHWGNLLISETKEKFLTVVLENVEYKIPSRGVKVCIIDFTLSRIYHEGFCVFNDLSVDPTLFTSVGDYQFEIYRMMLREVKNDWSLFRPKTNIFWLHYTLDKMIEMVRYKNKKTKLHKKGERDLKMLKSVVLDFKDTTDFALSDSLREVLKNL